MTVAQLAHPARAFGWHSRRGFFLPTRGAAFRRWSRNVALWRAIGTGLGFAAIGLIIISLAIGAAGVAAPASGARVDAPVAARAIPNYRVEFYQEPPEALTGAMPVP